MESNALNAYAPKLLPELPNCFPSFVPILAGESHLVRPAPRQFRKDADAAFRAGKISRDALFCEHDLLPLSCPGAQRSMNPAFIEKSCQLLQKWFLFQVGTAFAASAANSRHRTRCGQHDTTR
jgi:hypothetical protein